MQTEREVRSSVREVSIFLRLIENVETHAENIDSDCAENTEECKLRRVCTDESENKCSYSQKTAEDDRGSGI